MKTLAILILSLLAISVQAESVVGKITRIEGEFGNIETTLTQKELDQVGLTSGDSFRLTHKATTTVVTLGTTYADVATGEWIAFINWEKNVRLARNSVNAAESLMAEAGDEITITKIEELK